LACWTELLAGRRGAERSAFGEVLGEGLRLVLGASLVSELVVLGEVLGLDCYWLGEVLSEVLLVKYE
jgi:hypothetical protein